MVIPMHTHLAASVVLTFAVMSAGLQSAAAQSPPKTERNSLIWSDRDLSLRPGGFDSSPDVETTPRMPQFIAPSELPDARQGEVLVCEPGRIGSADAAAAAYAQLGKDWRLQTRR